MLTCIGSEELPSLQRFDGDLNLTAVQSEVHVLKEPR